jgi:uncharacterized protein
MLNAPPLVNPTHQRFAGRVVHFNQRQRLANQQWLEQLENNTLPLGDWLAKKPDKQLLRLGRYAEHLLEFYLRFGPCFKLVAANLPIRMAVDRVVGDRTTVGEIDFLLTDNDDGLDWHWELAVKYFLCLDVDDPQPTDFVGPEAIEVFEYKLQKLFDRQLNNQPPAPFNDRSWHCAAYTRGWIFYPLTRTDLQVQWLSPKHLRGVWLSISQVTQLPDQYFEILNRQRWLSPARGIANSVLTCEQLEKTIRALWAIPNAYQQYPSPVLIAALQPCSPIESEFYAETRRLFIVPDQWIGFDLQAQRAKSLTTTDRSVF